jgi:GTP-binding protein
MWSLGNTSPTGVFLNAGQFQFFFFFFEAIIKHIPAPTPRADHLQFLVTSQDHSDYLGPLAVGRMFSGSLTLGQQIIMCKDGTTSSPTRINKIYKFQGLSRYEVPEAHYGDICVLAGFENPISIGTTICELGHPLPLPYVQVDEPTMLMFVSVNDSPFAGKEGSLLTSRQIKERLEKELRTNVALRVEPTDSPETFKIAGRGQLHLGVLIENMRREGFELQLSAPEVILKTINGVVHEPIELVIIDIPSEYQGVIMENMGMRKANMVNMTSYDDGRMRLEYEIPARALLGFRSQFLTDTRGNGVASFSFSGYQPFKGEIQTRTKGAIVSMEAGAATGFALFNLQERGILFIPAGTPVYEGMVIGEYSRDRDLDVNACREKKLSNMRAVGHDEAVRLTPHREMGLENALEWLSEDELVEVTPQSIRLRKKILQQNLRPKRRDNSQ